MVECEDIHHSSSIRVISSIALPASLVAVADQGSPAVGTPTLQIHLFGPLDLRADGAPLEPLESARAASLLAYLLLNRQAPQPRQRLAFLLWPDSSETQARTNLRHVLHTLRHALPDASRFLDVTPGTLQWRADAPCWLDVAAFEETIARAEREAGVARQAALREAIELYTGDVMEGCYDDWLLKERERLRQIYCEALRHLTALLEAGGETAQAILYAERLLRRDSLDEETYRLLMRLHGADGDRARALRVYHQCVATLERELGIAPSPPTRAAYEALLPPGRPPVIEERRANRPERPALVGRLAERKGLMALWRTAERGGGRMVVVTGEPGIGKTRLIEEFRVWCVQRGAVSASARAYAAEGALAYAPVVAWLRAEPIKARLRLLDRARLSELGRLLPELLSEIADLLPPEPLPESDQRPRLFDAAARAILAAGPPLLLVADDLQWWDQESLQFLHYLLRVEEEARLLVAGTARREDMDERHPLNALRAGLAAMERYTEMDLDRLSPEETTTLAERVSGRPLAADAAGALYRDTEGSPLFVVEALRAGWTGERAGEGWTSPKVQAVIESRLGQLSEPARDLAGIAAAIGREFTVDILASASEIGGPALVRGLDELWRRRIIREEGAEACDFSHDKIREVAYLALSPALRRRHHLCVARALEQISAHDLEAVSGQIASHYERAGAAEQAIIWYQRAAEAAQRLHASGEAARLLSRALDLIGAQPASPARDAGELAALTSLLGVLHTEGYGSPRLAETQRRALELARALEIEPAPPVLRSLALKSLSTGDFAAAQRAGERLRARGAREADDVLLVEAAYVLGIAAFWSGDLAAARHHFEAAIDRYRPEQLRRHLLSYGQDPNVVCQSRLSDTLWFLGLPESAARARDAALALAGEIGHPYSRRIARVFAALLALEMRDLERLRAEVAALRAERPRDEAEHVQIIGEVFAGYLDVCEGRKDAGLARIQRARDESPSASPTPGHHEMIARIHLAACAAAGDARAGLAAADRALAMGGARLWDAEAHRLRAAFLVALGAAPDEVERTLERAQAVAHAQGATVFELRALMSFIRYRVARDGGAGVTAARDRLATILAALPESASAPDLREATALLHAST